MKNTNRGFLPILVLIVVAVIIGLLIYVGALPGAFKPFTSGESVHLNPKSS